MSLTSGTRFIGISENVNLKERKSAVINAETQPFTAQDIANFIGPGATGPQGVQGPAGPLGPVGPAGLTWRGAWVSGTSYIANDAVGYNGASYFCILATSGTSNPTVATTNWALLASQGAQGIQGVQGPTGPQGAGATQTLQQTVALGNTIDQGEGTVLSIASSELKIQDSLGGRLWLEYTSGSKPNIQFGIPNSGGLRTDLQTPDVQTASRTIKLPDASGTIALTSQLPGNSTAGDIEATSSAYPTLTYDLNTVNNTAASQRVLLPAGGNFGKEVIVYASNNAYTFQVRGAVGGPSSPISTVGVQAYVTNVTVSPNENYKFTHLGGGYWKAEAIGASLQQTINVGNIIAGGTNKTTLSGNSAVVSNIATPTTAVEISSNAIYLNKGGTSTSIVLPSTVTGDHVYTLPNASGTIALTSQLPVPPYKSYVALLEFVNSTTIIPTVIYNTIGNGSGDGINDIAWSYNSSAQPKAVMSAGSPFTANKTVCVNSTYAQGNVIYNLSGYRNSNNQVRFYSVQISNSTASIAFVPFVYVEIRVYN